MDRILRIGFRKIGQWIAKGDGIAYELDTHSPHPNTLYAFVVDGEVAYIGKTTRTLRGRLNSYARPSLSQVTNLRNHANIQHALAANQIVEIFALPDEGLHHYGAFHLNLAAALEDSIIQTLDPPWNGGRKATAEDEVDQQTETALAPLAQATFLLKMQKTYWDKGFFNMGVAASSSIGADGQTIELLLGDSSEPALGTINRTANANGSPRIFGGRVLRAWIQENVSLMGELRIEVLSPTSIRLRPGQNNDR